MLIRDMSVGDPDDVQSLSHLFDDEAQLDATRTFLAEPRHHLFVAYEDDAAIGFVTGVEMTHPDKGTEMFLYELGVDESARNRGVGTALVTALADAARANGCYGMWVLTERDNVAAVRTYQRAGGGEPSDHVMIDWTFGDVSSR